MITRTATYVVKFGGTLVWRIAGFIVAVALIIVASGFIGEIAGHWIK